MVLKKIAELFYSARRRGKESLVAIHPCVINGQPHIVYPRGLQQKSPDFYLLLEQHFTSRGYLLKEDQRSGQKSHKAKNKRSILAPVMLLTTSLLLKGTASATEGRLDETDYTGQKIELRLVPNIDDKDPLLPNLEQPSQVENTSLNSQVALDIFRILLHKYDQQFDDPGYITEDFKQIANYYSEFPEIVHLFSSLKTKNWQLAYSTHNWSTTALGTAFDVNNVTIYFDTRSAAQLRLNNGCKDNPVCVASPADTLLHELLHLHSMLVKTEEFLAEGGMSSQMYPYLHENSIIKQERELYTRMTEQDAIKRPYRFEHVGKAITASCPTCIN
jgi:hypothetical protein